MRAVIQRVSRAKVDIEGKTVGAIDAGLLVLLGITHTDNSAGIKWMCNKIANLRVFPDDEGKMNKSVLDIGGGLLVISNFTVYGDTRKGFRPNFMNAAPPEIAIPIYNEMIDFLKNNYPIKIESGVFGAMMDIELVNDGPVTVVIDN